jgi:hypothetical protein
MDNKMYKVVIFQNGKIYELNDVLQSALILLYKREGTDVLSAKLQIG